jgi:hypothetical protein
MQLGEKCKQTIAGEIVGRVSAHYIALKFLQKEKVSIQYLLYKADRGFSICDPLKSALETLLLYQLSSAPAVVTKKVMAPIDGVVMIRRLQLQ